MIGAGGHGEFLLDIGTRSAVGVDERAVAARIEVQIERRAREWRTERLQRGRDLAGRRPRVRDLDGLRLMGVGLADDADAARVGQQRIAAILWPAVAVVDGQGEIDRRQRIDESRALFAGGRAQVGGGTHDDLPDHRRRWVAAAVRAAIGLNDQCGLARRQRRRLAGAAEILNG